MKNIKIKFIFLIVMTLLMTSLSVLASPEKYGPEGKRLGVGISLGEPMEATVKGYIWDNLALQGGFGWSLVEEGLVADVDATYDLFDLSSGSGQSSLPVFVGLGFKLGFDQGGADDGKTHAVFRAPIGVSLQLKDDPLEFFIQAAPGIEFNPQTEFDITAGIGARYYFF
ncbi:MAG: hypothetical protein ACD_73C00190G0002 [uncultured bacterium]|nr:MAG: hypothetical protein ACD_73C00190G0002 [uncultured bacterium]